MACIPEHYVVVPDYIPFDLDFGIYWTMNFKRDVIEQFIQKDLIKAVDKELSSGMLASQSQAALELKEVAAQVREQLNENALNGDGHIDVVFGTTTCLSCFDENERPAQVIALSYPREKP